MRKGVVRFTAEELEALAEFDALVDAEEMTHEDYETSRFVEKLLSPKKNTKRVLSEETKRKNNERAAAFYQEHKKEIAVRKAAWYQKNKARISAQQKDYRIRSGKQRAEAV